MSENIPQPNTDFPHLKLNEEKIEQADFRSYARKVLGWFKANGEEYQKNKKFVAALAEACKKDYLTKTEVEALMLLRNTKANQKRRRDIKRKEKLSNSKTQMTEDFFEARGRSSRDYMEEEVDAYEAGHHVKDGLKERVVAVQNRKNQLQTLLAGVGEGEKTGKWRRLLNETEVKIVTTYSRKLNLAEKRFSELSVAGSYDIKKFQQWSQRLETLSEVANRSIVPILQSYQGVNERAKKQYEERLDVRGEYKSRESDYKVALTAWVESPKDKTRREAVMIAERAFTEAAARYVRDLEIAFGDRRSYDTEFGNGENKVNIRAMAMERFVVKRNQLRINAEQAVMEKSKLDLLTNLKESLERNRHKLKMVGYTMLVGTAVAGGVTAALSYVLGKKVTGAFVAAGATGGAGLAAYGADLHAKLQRGIFNYRRQKTETSFSSANFEKLDEAYRKSGVAITKAARNKKVAMAAGAVAGGVAGMVLAQNIDTDNCLDALEAIDFENPLEAVNPPMTEAPSNLPIPEEDSLTDVTFGETEAVPIETVSDSVAQMSTSETDDVLTFASEDTAEVLAETEDATVAEAALEVELPIHEHPHLPDQDLSEPATAESVITPEVTVEALEPVATAETTDSTVESIIEPVAETKTIDVPTDLDTLEHQTIKGDTVSKKLIEFYPQYFKDLSLEQWNQFIESVNDDETLLAETGIRTGDLNLIHEAGALGANDPGDLIRYDLLAEHYINDISGEGMQATNITVPTEETATEVVPAPAVAEPDVVKEEVAVTPEVTTSSTFSIDAVPEGVKETALVLDQRYGLSELDQTAINTEYTERITASGTTADSGILYEQIVMRELLLNKFGEMFRLPTNFDLTKLSDISNTELNTALQNGAVAKLFADKGLDVLAASRFQNVVDHLAASHALAGNNFGEMMENAAVGGRFDVEDFIKNDTFRVRTGLFDNFKVFKI